MEENPIDFVKSILIQVYNPGNSSFTGVGLILYKEINGLPVSGLRQNAPEGLDLPYYGEDNIARIIKKLNNAQSNYHDGFHLMSKGGTLTHLCQYFSPPITDSVIIDYTKGGRFRAAQYGSCIENVLAVGVIGQDYGPHIFIKGLTYQL